MRWLDALLRHVPCLRQRVLLNLTNNEAIRGVLFEQRGRWFVVKNAEHVSVKGTAVPMDGDVLIECDKVLFIQIVGS